MNWPHFTESELKCKCGCGRCEMDREFMEALEGIRTSCDFPFPVLSGFRCPQHDHNEGTSDTPGSGPHTTGKAVDIRIDGAEKYRLVDIAFMRGITGIGVYSWGLHLDRLTNDERPRPRIWGG